MFNPELKPLQPAIPGNAILTIRNWDGAHEAVSLTIQRNQDQNYLNDNGEWVGNAFEHHISLLPEGDNFFIALNKNFVDPLVSNLQMAYRLTLKDDEGFDDIGTLKIHSEVLSSQAQGQGQQESIKSGATLQAPTPAIAEPEIIIEPEPAIGVIDETEINVSETKMAADISPSSPQKAKKSPLIAVIAAILLLAIIGALVWFFVLKEKHPETVEPTATAQVTTPTKGVEGPCSVENMSNANALAFVQSCLKSHPSDSSLMSTIDAAIDNNQCDIAQRLYAYKAQAGDTKVAFKYAQQYDPDVKNTSKCFSPDKETAMYWYEIVVNNDSQNSEAKARLEALKK